MPRAVASNEQPERLDRYPSPPCLRHVKPKARRFVIEFQKDYNPILAGHRAGYAETTADSLFYDLKNKYAHEIRLYGSEVLADLGVETKRILQELNLIAFHNPADFFDDGDVFKGVKAMGEAARCIKSHKRTVRKAPTGGTEEVFEVTFYSKLEALEKLSKTAGLYNDEALSAQPLHLTINIGGETSSAVLVGEGRTA